MNFDAPSFHRLVLGIMVWIIVSMVLKIRERYKDNP